MKSQLLWYLRDCGQTTRSQTCLTLMCVGGGGKGLGGGGERGGKEEVWCEGRVEGVKEGERGGREEGPKVEWQGEGEWEGESGKGRVKRY